MKIMSEDEIKGAFLEAYSDEFLQDILKALATTYTGSHGECKKKWPKPEAHDAYPHVRRADLEMELANLVQSRYPEIKCEPQQNEKKTSWYRLFTSKDVLLTVHCVPHPKIPVRPALYREVHASTSQYHLFEVLDPPSHAKDAEHMLYAMLVHGTDGKHLDRPAFSQIVFPNKDCTGYIAHIDLFNRYTELVNSLWTFTEEVVEDNLEGFGLRPGAREEAEKDRGQDKKEEQK